MNIQWYPGHMTKAKRQMTEDLKLIDLVIELTDARIPSSSRNPDIDEMAKEKSRLILLNKADMADEKATSEWKTWFEEQGFLVCPVNSLNRADLKKINPFVREACAEKIERDKRRGIRSRPVRAMVTGIPNVGKSTFINSFSGKASAKTGNKPGVTKGKQWIRISDSLELLDTPGILWPKFEDQNVGIKLAAIGSIRDEIMNTEELSLELIKLLNDRYPGSLEAFYGIRIGEDEKPLDVLLKIAAARGCLSKGGSYDTLRASGLLLENFRNGKIGRFTLESPAG
ncbi:MAG: ribosome biogenesis GTPase YlqF [Parasporobacterium sp.]|nr:ribosome biogenesis GTPase YlqF [Parasporobacterium sp.]